MSAHPAFARSFSELKDDDPVDRTAVLLLALAARFAPGEPLPESLLLAPVNRENITDATIDGALRRLLQLGLLEHAGDGVYKLDRSVARFVDETLPPEMTAAARRAVERAVISLAYEKNMAGDPRPLRAWEAHLRHTVDAAFEREDEDAATLCTNFGYYLKMSGDLAGARPYFERALAIRERVLGPEHPDTAQSLNNMGYLLRAMGNLAGARPYYERALAIHERVLGPEHPLTASAVNNLGMLLQAMGDLAGARPYLERALAIWERVLGPEHPDTATSLWWLGVLSETEANREKARDYYARALAVYEMRLGPDHPHTQSVRQFLERVS